MSLETLLEHLRAHVSDERVLAAMASVPRECFVPAALAAEAWDNIPLPIGAGQTISQPLVVARMCELLQLRGGERILDIGTGSGYHAAVLSRLGAARLEHRAPRRAGPSRPRRTWTPPGSRTSR